MFEEFQGGGSGRFVDKFIIWERDFIIFLVGLVRGFFDPKTRHTWLVYLVIFLIMGIIFYSFIFLMVLYIVAVYF
jgi:hypothetical protein